MHEREEMQIRLVSEQQAGWLPPIAAIIATSRVHSFLPNSYFSGISIAYCTRALNNPNR